MKIDQEFLMIGPCSLESLSQVKPVAQLANKWGIKYFRAQLFKPRTSPFSFQGLGEEGMPIINYLKNEGLKLVSEVCSSEQLSLVVQFADIIQIGARNMQNFELLKNIGRNGLYQDRLPYVLLKRGFANTFEEWISAAKYLEESGVPEDKIILCERGTRNNASDTGITIDFAMAYRVKSETPYKVIIDPSHGTKDSKLVLPMAKLGMSLNYDGVMIEVHPRPKESVSDAHQAISVEEMDSFFKSLQ